MSLLQYLWWTRFDLPNGLYTYLKRPIRYHWEKGREKVPKILIITQFLITNGNDESDDGRQPTEKMISNIKCFQSKECFAILQLFEPQHPTQWSHGNSHHHKKEQIECHHQPPQHTRECEIYKHHPYYCWVSECAERMNKEGWDYLEWCIRFRQSN